MNKIYILDKPKKLFNSIILVDGLNDDIGQDRHKMLWKLSKYTNISFVFSKNCQKKFNPLSFSTLYRAYSYTITDSENETDGVLYTMSYFEAVKPEILGYLYMELSDMDGDLDIDSISNMCKGNVGYTTFRIVRQDSSVFSSVYLLPTVKNKYKEFFDTVMKKLIPHSHSVPGMFSTHTSNDTVLYIRPALISQFYEVDSFLTFSRHDYISSFKGDTFKTFISSFIELSETPNHLDYTIKEART